MPELIYPTRTKIRGPLLIDAAHLRELDNILVQQAVLLREFQTKMLEERIAVIMARYADNPTPERLKERRKESEDEARIYFGEDSQELIMYFSDGSKLTARSFDEAASHVEVSRKNSIGFDLSIKCGTVEAHLCTDAGVFGPDLTLDVSSDSETARNLFSALSRWLRSVQSPIWQQSWCKVGAWRPVMWLWFGLVALLVVLAPGHADKEYYQRQAQELMKQGVTAERQQKALETLLALNSDAVAPIEHTVFTRSGRVWLFIVTGLIICLILSYPPKIVLGLGVGEDRIRRWRTWTRFVFVIVPGFVASNFIWPVVSESIKRLAAR